MRAITPGVPSGRPVFRRLQATAAAAYEFAAGASRVRMCFGGEGRAWSCGPFASDALFFCSSEQPQGSRRIVLGGSYLNCDGERLAEPAVRFFPAAEAQPDR